MRRVAVAVLAGSLALAGCTSTSQQEVDATAPAVKVTKRVTSPDASSNPAPAAVVVPTLGSYGRRAEATVTVYPAIRTPQGLLVTVDVTPAGDISPGTSCTADEATASCFAALDPATGTLHRVVALASRPQGMLSAGVTYRLGAVLSAPAATSDHVSLLLGGIGVVPGVPVTTGPAPQGMTLPDPTVPASTPGPDDWGGTPGHLSVVPLAAGAPSNLLRTPRPATLSVTAPMASRGGVTAGPGVISVPGDLLYHYGQETLNAKAGELLDQAVTLLRAQADLTRPVYVIVHADGAFAGSDGERLTAALAGRSVGALTTRLPQTPLLPVGAGASQRLVTEMRGGQDLPDARALDRRLELRFTPKPAAHPAPRPAVVVEQAPAGSTTLLVPGMTGDDEPQPLDVAVYPVVRDGRFAVVRLALTPRGDAAASELDTALQTIDGAPRISIVTPTGDAAYGTLVAGTDGDDWSSPGRTDTVGTPLREVRAGRTTVVSAYTPAPPAGVTSVTVRLGDLGELTGIPVR